MVISKKRNFFVKTLDFLPPWKPGLYKSPFTFRKSIAKLFAVFCFAKQLTVNHFWKRGRPKSGTRRDKNVQTGKQEKTNYWLEKSKCDWWLSYNQTLVKTSTYRYKDSFMQVPLQVKALS